MSQGKLTARLLAIVLLGLIGCSKRSDTVTLIVSGDTKGWITPCGCAANQSGGLARRSTLIDVERKLGSQVIYLDAGGSAIGANEYQETRLHYLLNGLKLCQLDAHNIGGPETDFSPDQLRKLGLDAGVQWLSSNLLDDSGKTVGVDCVELNRGGLRIAVAGVIDPNLVVHPRWQASQPTQAVLNAFKNRSVDVRIVLAYLEESDLQELAHSLPEVDYIIGGPTGHALTPRKVGSVTVMSATNKGKFLAKAVLAKKETAFQQLSADILEVKSTTGEDRVQLKNLQAYYDQLKSKDYPSDVAGFVDDSIVNQPGYHTAGSTTCNKCHKEDDLVWQHSKHSHAWEPLVLKSAHYDPFCQQCHTTGYGQPGGFVSVNLSKNLVGVGCENCHGPSQSHVDNPKKKTPFLAKQQCTRCHDHENSPTFEFNVYWAKVLHAGKPQQNSGTPNEEGKAL